GGGQDFKRPADGDRDKLKVNPQEEMGALLALLVAQGDPAPGAINPRPQGIASIGKRGKISNTKSVSGRLWWTVNDSVLNNSPESRGAYVGPPLVVPIDPKEEDEREKRVRQWDYIVKNQYWNMWYDDNIGNFLVQIEIDSPH